MWSARWMPRSQSALLDEHGPVMWAAVPFREIPLVGEMSKAYAPCQAGFPYALAGGRPPCWLEPTFATVTGRKSRPKAGSQSKGPAHLNKSRVFTRSMLIGKSIDLLSVTCSIVTAWGQFRTGEG